MRIKRAFIYAMVIALVLPLVSPEKALAKGPDRTKLIMDAIGKPAKHKKVKKLIKALGTNVEKDEVSDGYYEYRYKSQGIELRMVDDTLAYVTLYAPDYNDFSAYTGELPYHISFKDNPERVKQKLGKPDIEEDEDSYLGLIYNGDKNIQVDFDKEDGEVGRMDYIFMRKSAYVPINWEDFDY
jgi:hypothetical protein